MDEQVQRYISQTEGGFYNPGESGQDPGDILQLELTGLDD